MFIFSSTYVTENNVKLVMQKSPGGNFVKMFLKGGTRMEYILFIFGLLIGSVITNLIIDLRTADGTLKIDHSNPEKDTYLFEVNDSLDKLGSKKRLVLQIDNEADLSQK